MYNQNFKDNLQSIEEANNKIFNNNNNRSSNIFNNIVFVYSQPKVGSTTLVSSIRISASNKYNVIHLHNELTLKILLGIENVSINDIIKYNAFLGRNVYVIDVYRTPIERKMSVFFEEISDFHFNNIEENVNTYDLKKVSKRFNDVFPFLATKDNYLDIFDIPVVNSFDFNKKYIHQKIDNINYIKLRLKDSLDWGKILTKLLGQEIVIIPDYETKHKKISKLYENFKNNYKIPSNLYEDIKNCNTLKYYYSEEERNDYLNKWQKKTTDPYIPFSLDLYNFYLKICLENQIYNFIQGDHYIDNGCLCNYCSKKRNELFINAKNGVVVHEKIVHNELINDHINNLNKNVINNYIKNVRQIQENKKKILNQIKNSNKSILRKNIISQKSNKLQKNILNGIIKPNR
jgi:hypothetical protein